VISQTPPEVLYHYTTQAGLLGILESRTIWATHTRFLNDTSEYQHALDLVHRHIAQIRPKNKLRIPALDAMKEGLSGVEDMCVCVFSLSEVEDSLSQWRAYGGTRSGYAVGISRDTLRKICKLNDLNLRPCVYNPDEQQQMVEALVENVVRESEYIRTVAADWRTKLGTLMAGYMHHLAPLLKDRSFHDEQEWRLISRPISTFAEHMKFRSGASTIVPYLQVSLDKSANERFCPSRIVVGPTPHEALAMQAVRLLLARHEMEECADHGVTASKVPYRNW
jgi:hypothetical protein